MKKIRINLLPFITLEEVYTIGAFEFWPVQKLKIEKLQKNTRLIDKVDKVINFHKHNYSKTSLKDAVIVLHNGNYELEDRENETMDVIDAINLFAYLGIDGKGIYSTLSYDNYIMHPYVFDLEKESDLINIQTKSGYNIMELDKVEYTVPYHIRIEVADRSMNKELQVSLDNLCGLLNAVRSEKRDNARRIIRAIKWFNQSKFNDNLFTPEVILVSLSVALETLLNIASVENKSEKMKEKIHLLLGPGTNMDTWVEEFYKKRSKIVHGSEMKEFNYGNHSSHILLAQIVFNYCLNQKLHLLGLWPTPGLPPTIYFKDLNYYLVSNEQKINELLKFTLENLYERERAEEFLNLAWTINTDSDLSGNAQFYKESIIKIANLLNEGLTSLKYDKEKYVGYINNFDEEINKVKDIISDIEGGQLMRIEELHMIDIVDYTELDEKFTLQIKHLNLADTLQIAYIYSLLNDLYDLYREHEIRERRL